jgi:hypothetical protein
MLKKYPFVLLPFLLLVQDSGFVDGRGNDGFAVVELFTSEGCSSCPPADLLLTKIIDETGSAQRIYCLSFHVDYWNYIGWKDPYSDKSYSERQRRYSQSFLSGRIYTPQMVVNGTSEFVGSSESEARKAIDAALRQSHAELLTVTSMEVENGRVTASFDFKGPERKYLLNIALVERGLAQRVTRGENSGRKLTHDNVVRVLQTTEIPSAQKGKLTLTMPADANPASCSVIAYAQTENMKVVAATERRL